MGSPLPHKHRVAGDLPPSMLPAVYVPADIPVEVDISLPKQLKDDHGAHILHDPMEDMFNWSYSSKSNTDDTPDPLKRRSRKKKSQGGLTNCLEPHPVEMQDVDMGPVLEQGTNTCPTAKQGMKQNPVASLLRSITGQLPHPLGKVAAIHALHPSQWYDECEIMDPRFMEAAAIATNTPATKHTPEQHRVYCCHHCAIKDVQLLLFSMEVDMPDDIHYWIRQWL